MNTAAGKTDVPGARFSRCAHIPVLLIAGLLVFNGAVADENSKANISTDEEQKPVDATVSLTATAYPAEWCITTFLDERRQASPIPVTRRAAPSLGSTAYPASLEADAALTNASDSASLMNRLLELNTNRLMTLWQGRSRSLVVGVQKGGYLGVSLDEDDDP